MPKISIIVPVYKVEKYLDECIKSILSQTFTDFELILVDDGSPDRCGTMCDEWAAKDQRIQVIHKENGGLSSARNAGLDIAVGRYVYFMDSDDCILPEFLETCVTPMLQDEECDSAGVTYVCVWEDGRTRHDHVVDSVFSIGDESQRLHFLLHTFMKCHITYNVTARIYLRAKIEELGLRFADISRVAAEDMCFNLCYFGNVNKVVSMNKPLYLYSIQKDSTTGSGRQNEQLEGFHNLAKEVKAFWERHGYDHLLKYFPIFYYLIIARSVDWVWNNSAGSDTQRRNKVLRMLGNGEGVQWLKKLPSYRKELVEFYGKDAAMERISFVKFLLNGNRIAYRLRNVINYRILQHIHK